MSHLHNFTSDYWFNWAISPNTKIWNKFCAPKNSFQLRIIHWRYHNIGPLSYRLIINISINYSINALEVQGLSFWSRESIGWGVRWCVTVQCVSRMWNIWGVRWCDILQCVCMMWNMWGVRWCDILQCVCMMWNIWGVRWRDILQCVCMMWNIWGVRWCDIRQYVCMM